MHRNKGVVVGPGETRVISGEAIGGTAAPEASAAAAAPAAARGAGAGGNTGIVNLGGTVRIQDSTVTGPDGSARYIDDLTLGPEQTG